MRIGRGVGGERESRSRRVTFIPGVQSAAQVLLQHWTDGRTDREVSEIEHENKSVAVVVLTSTKRGRGGVERERVPYYYHRSPLRATNARPWNT